MESQLKSLTVNTLRQGLGNIHHKRDLKCKSVRKKMIAGIVSNIVQKVIPHDFFQENREIG